ncbi:MAG: hypothetical protein CMI01_11880 [Oceanospirillaceae bacterium]|nr:hypothetical protein [Oceanospirillaceae bacterium]
MRWLCLHFPWLALELHGIPADQPQALLDTRQRIDLANPCAQDQGVKPGQALATALALSSELQLLETPAARLHTALNQLALWAGGYSARISLCPPRALLLEMASMLHYFGGLDAYLRRIREGVASTGYTVRLAIGETARGTELLAATTECLEPDKRQWWQRLEALPIDALGLPIRQAEQLQGVGLSTLGELRALPRRELAQRFGQDMLDSLDRILDPGAALPDIFEPPEQFQQRIELGSEVSHTQGLLFPLRRLLAMLEGFLRQRQQHVTRIKLQLYPRDGQIQVLTVHHDGGCVTAAQWMELCRLRLERERLQAPVLILELIAEPGQSRSVINQDLFAPARNTELPEQLISRLRSRLGEHAVMEMGVQLDHRPEQVISARTGRGAPVSDFHAARPGWLLSRPQPLSAHLQRRLDWLMGPERICSGWWDKPVARDYFIARWPDGRCGWVFRDTRGHWFIHGWFG